MLTNILKFIIRDFIDEKLTEYEKVADAYFETDKFEEFRAKHLQDLDDTMWNLVRSQEFDDILVDTVRSTFPEYEQARFIAHYRGLLNHWVEAEAR